MTHAEAPGREDKAEAAGPVPVEARWGLPAPGADEFWRARRRLYALGPAESLPWERLWRFDAFWPGAAGVAAYLAVGVFASVMGVGRGRPGGEFFGLAAIVAAVAVGAFFPPSVRKRAAKQAARRQKTACARCGYDRAGLLEQNPCPECGCRILVGDVSDPRVFRALQTDPSFGQARDGTEFRELVRLAGSKAVLRQWWPFTIAALGSLTVIFIGLFGSQRGLVPIGGLVFVVVVVIRLGAEDLYATKTRRARLRVAAGGFASPVGDVAPVEVSQEPAR